jgi:hypothetical protein
VSDATEAQRNLDEMRKLIDRISRIEDPLSRCSLSGKALEAGVDLEYAWEEDHCTTVLDSGNTCGASLDDGEGFDGKCGNCADVAKARGDYADHD